MGYWLLFALILELFIFYIGNGKNVISPSFIGCAMFLLSTVIYLSAEEYFGYEIHLNTVIVIASLLLCIFFGEMFAKKIKIKELPQKRAVAEQEVVLPIWLVLLITLFVLVMAALLLKVTYEFSLENGNTPGNFLTMAKYTREAEEPLKIPTLISQGKVISECIIWFCVYCIFLNKSISGKFYARYLFPIIPYLLNLFSVDNRVSLLKMVAVICVIAFVFIKQKNSWTSKGNVKILVWGVLAICIFLVLFRWLGYRTETSMRNELWDNLTEYTSAGVVGLDVYMEKGEEPNVLFGESTLKGIYNILRQWGAPIPEVEEFEPFYFYAHGNSNCYTAFKAYIQDFTLIGAVFAMFLWGLVLSYNMKSIQKNGAGFVRMCMVGAMFYSVAMLSIADTTSTFLSMGTVYQLVYLFLIDAILIKKKIRLRLR